MTEKDIIMHILLLINRIKKDSFGRVFVIFFQELFCTFSNFFDLPGPKNFISKDNQNVTEEIAVFIMRQFNFLRQLAHVKDFVYSM